MLVYLVAYTHSLLHIRSSKELHGYTPAFHTPGGIDSRAYLEYDVIYGKVSRFESGELDHRHKALTRIAVELLESVMGKNSVLSHNRHKVRRYADHQKVHQRNQSLERDAISLRICLDKFEANPAARKVVERIEAVFPLRIEDSYRLRKFVFRKMVVAYYHIYPSLASILDLFVCLDAAVKGNDEVESVFRGPVYAFIRHAIAFIVSFRNIEIQIAGQSAEERIHQRNRCRAIHIVVAIDKDLFTA